MSRLDKERAILVGVVTHDQTLTEVNEYLDELAFLADTACADIVSRQIQ